MMQKEKPHNQSVCIIGGGLVGMATALVLSDLGLKIHLIEGVAPEQDSHPGYDDRTLVVNQASLNFWQNTGVWPLVSENAVPIKRVHVSNKGHFGAVTFDAGDFNIDELAFIVEAKRLGMALRRKISAISGIKITCPAKFLGMVQDDDKVQIKYEYQSETFDEDCKLLIAADGIQSGIRNSLGLETQIKSYEKTAIICNITPEFQHNGCAYERFTTNGPTALLPFVGNRCGFVWSVKNQDVASILSLSDDEFLNQAQNQFGYRLGRFMKVGKRSSYPLYFVKVPHQTSQRVILMGNAAHGMSPISAQGLNLAVRDIARLSDIIQNCLLNQQDIGSSEILDLYQKSVSEDQDQTMRYTDDLMGWFRLDEPVINKIRSLGLFTLQQLKPLKNSLFSRASGYRGATPVLLRNS